MGNLSKFEKLTHVQLQQKIIHLESELSLIRTNREIQNRKDKERINMLKQDNESLRLELQEALNENGMYNEERDQLIKDYNKLLMKNSEDENKILQLEKHIGLEEIDDKIEKLSLENDKLIQLTENLTKQIDIHQETIERYDKEKQISDQEIMQLQKELTQSENECKMYQQKNIQLEADKDAVLQSEKELRLEISNLKSQVMELEKVKNEMSVHLKERENQVGKLQEEYNQVVEEKTALHTINERLQLKLSQNEKDIAIYKEKKHLSS